MKTPVDDWLASDQEQAFAQGWGVFECIDEKTLKFFYEVQSHGKRFGKDNPDKHARTFVTAQSNAGDALANKAIRAVFRSKVGANAKTKTRKKR